MYAMKEISQIRDDAGLVGMARAGKHAAFDTLVRRFQRAVHAVAFAVLADREAALDVLQESFITAYRRLNDLDDPNKFGPWVCGIARNQAKLFLRTRGRRASYELHLPDVERAQGNPYADDKTERIREALGCLTEPQSDAVTLFYMEGYSIAECSALLGVPQGTIKRRLHDARQRLKKEMTDVIRKQLPEFALPEDYKVVIEKPTPIHTARPVLVYFQNRWVLLWQDGVPWEPYDGPFWFWMSESRDGKTWSEPHKLDLPAGKDEMRYNPDYLQIMDACVVGNRLAFVTQQFAGHFDMYSSEDTVNWTIHPRLRMGPVGRPSLFSSRNELYLLYPSLFDNCRVDLIRSSDGGFSWTWLNSPYWGDGGIYDTAGVMFDGSIYAAWREISCRYVSTGEVSGVVRWQKRIDAPQDPDVPEGQVTQQVWTGRSDDGGETWDHRVWRKGEYPDNSGFTIYPLPEKPEPLLVESLDLAKPYYSNSLTLAACGDTLALAQGVRKEEESVEIWVAFSRDGGKTWPEKAVYSNGNLGEPAVAFAPDGTLMLAGSSRTGDKARPWVVQSRIES